MSFASLKIFGIECNLFTTRDVKWQSIVFNTESPSWDRCRKVVPGCLRNVVCVEAASFIRRRGIKSAILGIREFAGWMSPFSWRSHTQRKQPSMHESMNTPCTLDSPRRDSRVAGRNRNMVVSHVATVPPRAQPFIPPIRTYTLIIPTDWYRIP